MTATLFLRLEGPMQAWGNHESKFLVRRTHEAPTKSGVIGLLLAAMGVERANADEWLPRLNALKMGVRIDAPGIRWWDYHTVGAGMEMATAGGRGKTKDGAMLTRREYLCDASFLAALQGDAGLISDLETSLRQPVFTLALGRKCCPPSRPIQEKDGAVSDHTDLLSALKSVPWHPRRDCDRKQAPLKLDCLLEWQPAPAEPRAPADALIWYDAPNTLEPPYHRPRFLVRSTLTINQDVAIGDTRQTDTPKPPRPRANYKNEEYRNRRKERLASDHHLCIFCKSPATTVQHITYRRAGGNETQDDLRSLCRLCHDAVTMIEYGLGMGLDRINPEEPQWRDRIEAKRKEIIKYRSLETRRRRLTPDEVE